MLSKQMPSVSTKHVTALNTIYKSSAEEAPQTGRVAAGPQRGRVLGRFQRWPFSIRGLRPGEGGCRARRAPGPRQGRGRRTWMSLRGRATPRRDLGAPPAGRRVSATASPAPSPPSGTASSPPPHPATPLLCRRQPGRQTLRPTTTVVPTAAKTLQEGPGQPAAPETGPRLPRPPAQQPGLPACRPDFVAAAQKRPRSPAARGKSKKSEQTLRVLPLAGLRVCGGHKISLLTGATCLPAPGCLRLRSRIPTTGQLLPGNQTRHFPTSVHAVQWGRQTGLQRTWGSRLRAVRSAHGDRQTEKALLTAGRPASPALGRPWPQHTRPPDRWGEQGPERTRRSLKDTKPSRSASRRGCGYQIPRGGLAACLLPQRPLCQGFFLSRRVAPPSRLGHKEEAQGLSWPSRSWLRV